MGAFFLLQFTASIASFSTVDFKGPFVRRHGISNCPDNLSFETNNTELSPSNVIAGGQPCTSGILKVSMATYDAETSGVLGANLYSERGVGDVYVIDVVETLMCPEFRFSDRAWITLAKPSANVTIDWNRIFRSNDTTFQISTNSSTFTLESNISYVFVGSDCLYSRLSDEEAKAQLGEACFPANEQVMMHDGRLSPIQNLKVGDSLASRSSMSPCSVIGWTHWRPSVLRPFIQIKAENGRSLIVSHRHFVYLCDTLHPARMIKVGDCIRFVSNGLYNQTTVISIAHVWRRGVFNAQTTCGDIVVNDFMCSTYTEAIAGSPLAAHALLLPIRAAAHRWPDLLAWTHLFEDERYSLKRSH